MHVDAVRPVMTDYGRKQEGTPMNVPTPWEPAIATHEREARGTATTSECGMSAPIRTA